MNESKEPWRGVAFNEFAPEGSQPVLKVELMLDAGGRVCTLSLSPVAGREAAASMVSYKLGVNAIGVRP